MLSLFILIIGVLLFRAVDLQINKADFLQNQGNARHLRTLPIVAHRGTLLDRNGEPLAISTPVESVWINPAQFVTAQSKRLTLAELLGMERSELDALVTERMQREFVYLKRHISPSIAHQVSALELPGVFLQREYRRYYPTGAICAHVLGFTNIDDQGQEGLELALNGFLTGVSGAKRVMQNQNGQIIAFMESLRIPRAGQNIHLSIDRRLQYLAYRELKTAVLRSHARAGSAIILDVRTGEVLAMVNQPAYNPNNRGELQSARYRNRVITDVFEPGSTLKPFTIAAALESGKYTPTTRIDTRPGYLQLGQYKVSDSRNYGIINVATVIQKSSNVGASKIALSLPPKRLWHLLTQVGLGRISGSGFPGEIAGHLPHFSEWHTTEQATISFGYGINVTLLQLARAYAALGNKGILPSIRFFPLEKAELAKEKKENFTSSLSPPTPNSQFLSSANVSLPIMQANTAQQVLYMLENVVKPSGTGARAQIIGFRVAGKTGTVHKLVTGEYSENNYLALFAGIVPVSNPRLVMVVLIDEPRSGSYYGGQVAAPVFAKVMEKTLRLLNIPPDNIKGNHKELPLP